MTPKYKECDQVIVDGSATGYGDLEGRITEVVINEEIYPEPYYKVLIEQLLHTNYVFVAERFIDPKETFVKTLSDESIHAVKQAITQLRETIDMIEWCIEEDKGHVESFVNDLPASIQEIMRHFKLTD